MYRSLIAAVPLLAVAAPLAAQHGHAPPPPATSDSAFRQVQSRGHAVMGVDQYTSRHVFASLEDGGSITLTRDDTTQTDDITQIRLHMRQIAGAFARGDFTAPFLVHAQTVPGTDVMSARRAHIRYSVRDLPAGAELLLVTADAHAKRAIHEFLAFQRMDHRAH